MHKTSRGRSRSRLHALTVGGDSLVVCRDSYSSAYKAREGVYHAREVLTAFPPCAPTNVQVQFDRTLNVYVDHVSPSKNSTVLADFLILCYSCLRSPCKLSQHPLLHRYHLIQECLLLDQTGVGKTLSRMSGRPSRRSVDIRLPGLHTDMPRKHSTAPPTHAPLSLSMSSAAARRATRPLHHAYMARATINPPRKHRNGRSARVETDLRTIAHIPCHYICRP